MKRWQARCASWHSDDLHAWPEAQNGGRLGEAGVKLWSTSSRAIGSGSMCMCLLYVCVLLCLNLSMCFARCLGATRRLQTRSWPIPSGYILICKDDFTFLTLDINIYKCSVWNLVAGSDCKMVPLYICLPLLAETLPLTETRVNFLKTHFKIFQPLMWNTKVERNIIFSSKIQLILFRLRKLNVNISQTTTAFDQKVSEIVQR